MTPDVGENTEETSPYVGDSEEDLRTLCPDEGKNSETDILWERRGTVENQQATVITLAQLFEASLDKIRTIKA